VKGNQEMTGTAGTVGEAFYATKLVRNIISRGLYISIDNGEEEPTDPSRVEGTILPCLGATEIEMLRFYRRDAGGLHHAGSFCLVWGNCPSGEELVCDHTDNRLCNSIWGEVFGREAACA
jgi:hypothetical protein